ncbi:MAG: conserved phage C-terminal domain-containing protein [Tannerellaceae bacterium]|jgi:hypothetical protein|nr:conserved phage C-terminal domain-containing protein [Tannerellaceae bacterium]
MARIRTIKPEFWEDEKIASLPMSCRLFYIGTWNLADDNGVIRANPVILKSKIFPYDENLRVGEVSKWIDSLVKARMLVPISYENESYYVIRTFRSHQKFDARYPNNIIDKDLLEKILKEAQESNDVTTTGTQRVHDVTTTGTQHGKGKGKGKGISISEDICRVSPDPSLDSGDFSEFIAGFNRIRGSRFQAIDKVKRQFNARLKEGFTPAQMLQALETAMKDRYHISEGYKYLTPEFFTRSDKIDKFINVNSSSPTSGQEITHAPQLGADEWMRPDGTRTYGSGKTTVPIDAPPRPSVSWWWNDGLKQWNM